MILVDLSIANNLEKDLNTILSTLLLAIKILAYVSHLFAIYLSLGILTQILKMPGDSNSSNSELAKAIELHSSYMILLQDSAEQYADEKF